MKHDEEFNKKRSECSTKAEEIELFNKKYEELNSIAPDVKLEKVEKFIAKWIIENIGKSQNSRAYLKDSLPELERILLE